MILPVPQKLPIGKIIGHPYEGDIANFKEKKYSIDRLSSLIHELNLDYLLFHPSINSIQSVSLLASYGAAWLFGQSFFIFYRHSYAAIITINAWLCPLFNF